MPTAIRQGEHLRRRACNYVRRISDLLAKFAIDEVERIVLTKFQGRGNLIARPVENLSFSIGFHFDEPVVSDRMYRSE